MAGEGRERVSDVLEDPPGSGLWTTWDFSEVEAGLYASLSNVTSFTYRGIHIDLSGPFYLQSVDGWASVDGSAEDAPAPGGHGSLVTPVSVRVRTVTVSGVCVSESLRDSLFWALRRAAGAGFNENTVTSPLVGDHAGIELTADAQLIRWQATVEQGRWPKGVFGFDIEFRCPDPKLYGASFSLSSPMPQAGAGLALPLALPAAFPDASPGGGFRVLNDGTALSDAIYTLTGPVSWPGVLLNSGTSYQQKVQYQLDLAVGDSLVINTAAGGAGLLNGEYRPPFGNSGLTSDLMIRPGENTVKALGTPGVSDPPPSISVTFRPAYW